MHSIFQVLSLHPCKSTVLNSLQQRCFTCIAVAICSTQCQMQTLALKMGEGSLLFYSEWIWASALLQQMNPLVNISAQAGKEDKTETILQITLLDWLNVSLSNNMLQADEETRPHIYKYSHACQGIISGDSCMVMISMNTTVHIDWMSTLVILQWYSTSLSMLQN